MLYAVTYRDELNSLYAQLDQAITREDQESVQETIADLLGDIECLDDTAAFTIS